MDDAADYRPVSPLAVAALVVGACASLAVVTRFAWVLPLVGVGLSLAALADIARPGAAKAGRLAALAGLALSLGFGTQAVVADVVDRWIVGRRAADAATVWIDAVREGRPADALAVLGPEALATLAADHHAPAADGDEPRMARFSALPPVRAVAACGATRPAITAVEPAGGDGGWMVRAPLAACGDATATLRLVVTPKRVATAAGPVERWTVRAFDVER